MSFLNGARWLNGAIEGVLNWVPSINRVIDLPDKSGTVALVEDLRTKATSQPIFYVATTGSDSNNGLTVGEAFATIPKAIDVLTTIDCNGFDPVIYLAVGTYVQPLGGLVLKSCTGVATRVTIIGEAGANRINYKIQAQASSPTDLNATAIVKNTPTAYRFVGVEIGANFSHANYPKYVRASTPIEFEDCCFRGNNNTHDGIVSYASNTITFLGITQLEGTFRWPLDMLHSFVAFLPLGAQKPTFTTTSGCEFAVFLNGTNTTCLAHDTVHSGTGSFVGKRFELIEGRVETYNEGAGLPGNSAGTVTYPGVSGGSGSTDLSIGTRTSTALDILSSSGADVTLPAATTSLAGLLTGADKAKLNDIQEGAINQTTSDARYRLQSASIPANEISGTIGASQIDSSIARDTEVAAAVTAHESALDPHPGYRLESEQIPTTAVADLAEFVRDTIGATLAQGSNITITPDDPGNTITISTTSGGGGFTPVVAEYETPGTSSLFAPPTGATRLYVRVIAAGAGGGSGRRGAAGTQRGGGAGGQGGGWSEATLILAGLAAQLATTVDNLRFSVVVQAGGTGGAAITTDDTNGNAGGFPSGQTQLRVQAGTGGSPVIICRADSQGGGSGGTTAGGTVGFSSVPNTSNTLIMFANNTASVGGTGGTTTGWLAGWATAVIGGSGGQGINSSNIGASAISAVGAGMAAMGGSAVPNSTAGNNAVTHSIPFLSGGAGIGGASNGTTSRNGGNGYRGSGGGGGAASENGTASGAGGNGGNGYVGILWM